MAGTLPQPDPNRPDFIDLIVILAIALGFGIAVWGLSFKTGFFSHL